MARAKVVHSEDAVLVEFKGDKRNPEPTTGVMRFPVAIERSIVEGFKSTGEAVKWAFEHRTDAGGKSVEWMAKHLGIKRQRLSRILNHGD